MKKVICFMLCLLLLTTVYGCQKNDGAIPEKSVPQSSDTAEPSGEVKLKYTDLADGIFTGEYLGQTTEVLASLSDNVFVDEDNLYGIDYVSVGDTNGSCTFMKQENSIISCNFSSTPYEDKDILRNAFNKTNTLAAEKTGEELREPEKLWNGEAGTDEDEYDSLMKGILVLSSVYDCGNYTVTVTAVGVNNTATIAVSAELTV